MAEKKVTKMLIKVDLQCEKCYRKIKKVLCRFPQIRDQIYDEKKNTVTITVVCCNPDKIKGKICCKGGDTILGIEIIPDKPKEPEKPKQPEKPKEPEKPKTPEKPKEPEKPKTPEKPKEPEKPKTPEKPKEPEKPKTPEKPKEPEKPKTPEKRKEPEKPKTPEKPKEPEKPKPPAPELIPHMPQGPAEGYPQPQYAVGMCSCQPCYQGYGPCYHGFGRPVPICYDGYGRPAYECHGGNRGYYVSRCDYFNEENASGCTIM
ncbi:hypothetical protein SAY87_010562 [Trapa incisa]|uniref:HMA domain-containing protein n=1 Tax=Trapa incisa TaxID=236973 RepID=A0AAN7JI95_9MYRT|nr:hypothetical protein SAY87_010562 [Trapa incisa]